MASSQPASAGSLDVITQLNMARKLALRSSSDYAQLVQGVLPVVTPSADLSMRRWGADLIAEAFSSPHVTTSDKEKLAPSALIVLRALLTASNLADDIDIQKHCIQAASSLYPLVFRHCAKNPHDPSNWNIMIDVKNRIFQLMDPSSPIGVRMCCIKFFQRLILVQTVVQVDPRIQHLQADVSISLLPRAHPFLNHNTLQQEAMTTLDRILTTLLDISTPVVLLTAVMNCLGFIVRSRPTLLNVVVETALSFRPFAGVQKLLSPSSHVTIRSIERTTRLMFKSMMTKFPSSPLVPKVKEFLVKLERSQLELLDQASRKRSAPSDNQQQDSDNKRQRTAPIQASPTYPPLPDGPISLAQLVTLTSDDQITQFDVKALPDDVVSMLLVPLFQSIDERKVDRAINEIKWRCHLRNVEAKEKAAAAAPAQLLKPLASDLINPDIPADEEGEGEGEEDFYEPTLPPAGLVLGSHAQGGKSTSNEADDDDADDLYDPIMPHEINRGNSAVPTQRQDSLPQPQILPPDVAASIGSVAVDKILARIASMSTKNPDWKPGNGRLGGFGNLPASGNDRKSWVLFLARLATRADIGLDPDDFVDVEDEEEDFLFDSLSKQDVDSELIASKIREGLLHYVLQDFRRHIDLGITWLSEEWLNDKTRMEEHQNQVTLGSMDPALENIPNDQVDNNVSPRGSTKHQKRKWRRQRKQKMIKMQIKQQKMIPRPRQNYKLWTMKLIDSIVPFLESKDKVLIRLLSELPMLDREILSRVQKLAEDPERVGLCTQALQYLIMLRTPVREMCLDIVEDLFKNYDDARPYAKKIMVRWRPASLKDKGLPRPGHRQAPLLVDRSEATTPGDGLPWD